LFWIAAKYTATRLPCQGSIVASRHCPSAIRPACTSLAPRFDGGASGSAEVSDNGACQPSVCSTVDSFPQRISDVPRSSAVKMHARPVLKLLTPSIGCIGGGEVFFSRCGRAPPVQFGPG